jgi:hypothetical protein
MSPTLEKALTAIVSILLAIIGVAVIAILVSKQSNTNQVIGAGSGGFACMLATAMSGNPNNKYCSALTVTDVSSSITYGDIPDVNSRITYGGIPAGGGGGL